ncbi:MULTISPECIES: diphthine--ammonia ligase [Pedobacter]|uniref:Dph6-related ATP pyrophosphatase n=1 Tax=Pedobacter TaxID=84567 RepID=UPI00121E0CDE|nr:MULTISPECIES: diphthine--ammonia ligase [Pedobacter]RZL66936.1 MAG: diphthine--ammonia ligase [Pedobacter sp.]
MENKKLCIFNWSGGKDSALALHDVLQDPSIEIKYLVTTVTDQYNRVSMHGVRESLLIAQAESIGIPLYQIRLGEMPDMESYDRVMHSHLSKFKDEGITHSIFGDIFLEDLRNYRETKLAEVGMKAIFPLWKSDTNQLIKKFLDLHYKTIIVCAQQNLELFCGEILTIDLISKLPSDIDPCGENGEFHTFAFEGPIFKKNIPFKLGEKVFKTYNQPKKDNNIKDDIDSKNDKIGFWYQDLEN